MSSKIKSGKKTEYESITRWGSADEGVKKCCDEMAKNFEQIVDFPENTRSNPSDRVKRFREGTNWRTSEDAEKVLKSKMYKESAILFIHCVLSSVYGKNIFLKPYSFVSLKLQGKEGFPYFLEKLQEALYAEGGLKLDNKNLICIYYGDKLIGLFSSSGLIPSVDCPFLVESSEDAFLKQLKVDDTAGSESLLNVLEDQEKEIIKLYLNKHKDCIGDNTLFAEMASLLDINPSKKIEDNFDVNVSIPFSFPKLKGYDGNILHDVLFILRVPGKEPKFGYSMSTLLLEDETDKDDKSPRFACIPPLNEKCIKWIEEEKFELSSIFLLRVINNAGKIDSVSIGCKAFVNGIKLFYSRTYAGNKLKHINKFPVIKLYGIAPKWGYIARRDIEFENRVESPLQNKNKIEIRKVEDIELCGLIFEKISEEYEYSLHSGDIPEWVGIRISGDWCGGLPLRAMDEKKEENWSGLPAFAHKKFPEDKKLQVAVDIGSSRTIILFKNENHDSVSSVLIEKDQLLSISITNELGSDSNEFDFKKFLFQESKADIEVKGKIPLSVIFTPKKKNENPELYKEGKLLFLDTKTISEQGDWELASDIKSHIKDGNSEMKGAMQILVQGLLAVIIERAVRSNCSKIDIRLAYLPEQYDDVNKIWDAAKRNFGELTGGTGEKRKIEISYNLYLPESLAIANKLIEDGVFEAGSGAAIIDIGDYSTDIALFKNVSSASVAVKFLSNFSVYFGGAKIFLRTIWDYVNLFLASKKSERVETVFKNIFQPPYATTQSNKEHTKSHEQNILEKLQTEVKKNQNSLEFKDTIRNSLLCLIPYLNRGSLALQESLLQNLIDLGYLAEMLILKHCIKEITGAGVFNIYLFGGGSTYFKGQRGQQMVDSQDKKTGECFEWEEVLDRKCKIYDRSSINGMLASGLLSKIGEEIKNAVACAKKNASKEKTSNDKSENNKNVSFPDNKKELQEAYIDFILSAKKLKDNWDFQSSSEKDWIERLAGIKKDKTGRWQINVAFYGTHMDKARKFAIECMPSDGDAEIFKIFFAYKLAYLNILTVYEEELLYEHR